VFYRVLLSVLIVGVFLTSRAAAFQFLEPWGYVWMNSGQYKTNLEDNKFNSNITRVEGKAGIDLLPLWNKATLQPYFAYYSVGSGDLHSWNNNTITGGGVQVSPFMGMTELDWLQDTKIFYETLSIRWSVKEDDDWTDEPGYNYTTDTRTGFDLWHTWNVPAQYAVENRELLWGELWTDLSFRDTNFGSTWESDFKTYMFSFQPKVGIYLFKLFNNLSLEPYFTANCITSGKEYSYQNNIAYGAGIRVRPLSSGYILGLDLRIFKRLVFYAETLAVSYLKDRGDVDHDLRFGVDFNIGR